MAATASGEIQEDNDTARVTRWCFAPGAETGFHRHDLDYVVVPLTSGALRIVDKDGKESRWSSPPVSPNSAETCPIG